MNFLFPILFTVLGMLFPITVVAGIVGVIIFVYRKSKGEEINVSFDLVYEIYLYLVSFMAILLVGTGAVYTLKSTFTQYEGLEFSYHAQQDLNYVSEPVFNDGGEKRGVEEPGYKFETDVEKKDLIMGITFLVIATPIFFVHLYAAQKVRKKAAWNVSVYRFYLMIGLVIFAIVGIISFPVGVYETLQYYLTEQPESVWGRVVPGESLAVALSFVPIWACFFVGFNRLKK